MTYSVITVFTSFSPIQRDAEAKQPIVRRFTAMHVYAQTCGSLAECWFIEGTPIAAKDSFVQWLDRIIKQIKRQQKQQRLLPTMPFDVNAVPEAGTEISNASLYTQIIHVASTSRCWMYTVPISEFRQTFCNHAVNRLLCLFDWKELDNDIYSLQLIHKLHNLEKTSWRRCRTPLHGQQTVVPYHVAQIIVVRETGKRSIDVDTDSLMNNTDANSSDDE